MSSMKNMRIKISNNVLCHIWFMYNKYKFEIFCKEHGCFYSWGLIITINYFTIVRIHNFSKFERVISHIKNNYKEILINDTEP